MSSNKNPQTSLDREKLAEMFEDKSLLDQNPDESPDRPGSTIPALSPKPAFDSTVAQTPEAPQPAPKTKQGKNKFLALGAVVLLAGAGAAAFFLFGHKEHPVLKTARSNQSMASPVGFLEEVASEKQGVVTFKNNEHTQKTNYYIHDDELYLELIPNADIINKFLLQLANKDRTGENRLALNDEAFELYSASKYVRFNYTTLYGLDRLIEYDVTDLFSLHLPVVTGDSAARNAPNKNERALQGIAKRINNKSCKESAHNLKSYISNKRLNTGLFAPDKSAVEKEDSQTKFVLDNSKLSELTPMLETYIGACLLEESANKESDRQFYKDIIKNYSVLPTITIASAKEGAADKLTIDIASANSKDGGTSTSQQFSLIFEPNSEPSMPFEKQKAINDTFNSAVTQFALAYEKCRFTPVAMSDFTHSYHYLISDEGYMFPNQATSNYACSTLEESTAGYSPPDPMVLDLGQGRFMSIRNYGHENIIQKYHDISVYVEAFFVKNGRYPSLQEILSNKVAGLSKEVYTDAEGKKIGQGKLRYQLLPNGCEENCRNYKLEAELYVPATNNTIVLNHEWFEKRD